MRTIKQDFIYMMTAIAGVVAVVEGGLPFIEQLKADDVARAEQTIDVDISHIAPGSFAIVHWRGQPVIIRNRTPAEVEEAQHTPLSALKDSQANNPNQRKMVLASDIARSAGVGKENWLIVINRCTHLGCIPLVKSAPHCGWFCPCHGSVYDIAGRIIKGPADKNLIIPPYRFLSDKIIRIG